MLNVDGQVTIAPSILPSPDPKDTQCQSSCQHDVQEDGGWVRSKACAGADCNGCLECTTPPTGDISQLAADYITSVYEKVNPNVKFYIVLDGNTFTKPLHIRLHGRSLAYIVTEPGCAVTKTGNVQTRNDWHLGNETGQSLVYDAIFDKARGFLPEFVFGDDSFRDTFKINIINFNSTTPNTGVVVTASEVNAPTSIVVDTTAQIKGAFLFTSTPLKCTSGVHLEARGDAQIILFEHSPGFSELRA